MISKKFIYDKVLPLVKEKSRMLEYYLIMSLFENVDSKILEELKEFQNSDGGFGNGLEPDVQMPNSSILATNIAIKSLAFVKNRDLKVDMIKDIVQYIENNYDIDKERFFMVDDNVDNYPHAVWWNFIDLEKNFPFGNPDPEVIGFLYENRQFITKLNYSSLINKVVDYVMSDRFLDAKMHSLMSVMRFYKKVDDDVRNLIHDRIHLLVNKELDAGLGNWDEYSLEPYKIYIIEPHFTNTHLEQLGENLTGVIKKINDLGVKPNWEWYQYKDEFEKVKNDWIGQIYFDMIRALRLHRII
ncbi:hypothetical protein KQ51_00481 [Candidatus Izimaplasma bacterium HR1]|jgi:hypothetical protein|uniref:hypothetical protein n=1 Tax=Candidatus Izimoplasma sp. HR1 TaxID=1541959 RepID=UPI0004F83672|nr:hypothetical protein KQ51_00481 [Candidatus Izimaplasma bacterium HR1]